MRRGALLLTLLAFGVGCDDPPPPQPIQASATANPKDEQKKDKPSTTSGDSAAISQAAMKRLRAELCYYGGFGAEYALESYWASVGSKTPSPTLIPSFGDYGEEKLRGKEGPDGKKKDPDMKRGIRGRLPFDRTMRGCAAASPLSKGKWPELDEALAAFTPSVNALSRVLAHSARYYARKEYERDDFTSGKEAHQQLTDTKGDFEPKHRAYGEALFKWMESVEPLAKQPHRKDVGVASANIVAPARKLARAALATPVDTAALEAAEKELQPLLDGLEKGGPHVQMMVRQVKELIEVAKAVPADKPTKRHRHLVATKMAAVLQSDNRIYKRAIPHKRKGNARKPGHKIKARLPPKNE